MAQMVQWEYCTLSRVRADVIEDNRQSLYSEDASIAYGGVGDSGVVETKLRKIPFEQFSLALAALGLNGWELVSAVTNEAYDAHVTGAGHSDTLYFKRPVDPNRPYDSPPVNLPQLPA
jgi:hypothetical protein